MKKIMLLVFILTLSLAICASAQVQRISGPVTKVLVASGVSVGDTIFFDGTATSNTATSIGTKDLTFSKIDGGDFTQSDRRVASVTLFAKSPFFAKAFWASGDSSGLTHVKFDSLSSDVSIGYPVQGEFIGRIDQLRLSGTAADTVIVIPEWK